MEITIDTLQLALLMLKDADLYVANISGFTVTNDDEDDEEFHYLAGVFLDRETAMRAAEKEVRIAQPRQWMIFDDGSAYISPNWLYEEEETPGDWTNHYRVTYMEVTKVKVNEIIQERVDRRIKESYDRKHTGFSTRR